MKDTLQSAKCARYLKVLADPDRLKIIQCLRDGSLNVSQISQMLGLEIANVSHHLGVLRRSKLVISHREGKFVRYSLAPDMIHADPAGGEVVDLGCCRLQLGKK